MPDYIKKKVSPKWVQKYNNVQQPRGKQIEQKGKEKNDSSQSD
jgi:hypothetical protein